VRRGVLVCGPSSGISLSVGLMTVRRLDWGKALPVRERRLTEVLLGSLCGCACDSSPSELGRVMKPISSVGAGALALLGKEFVSRESITRPCTGANG
jgi:hypothetical protein